MCVYMFHYICSSSWGWIDFLHGRHNVFFIAGITYTFDLEGFIILIKRDITTDFNISEVITLLSECTLSNSDLLFCVLVRHTLLCSLILQLNIIFCFPLGEEQHLSVTWSSRCFTVTSLFTVQRRLDSEHVWPSRANIYLKQDIIEHACNAYFNLKVYHTSVM